MFESCKCWNNRARLPEFRSAIAYLRRRAQCDWLLASKSNSCSSRNVSQWPDKSRCVAVGWLLANNRLAKFVAVKGPTFAAAVEGFAC